MGPEKPSHGSGHPPHGDRDDDRHNTTNAPRSHHAKGGKFDAIKGGRVNMDASVNNQRNRNSTKKLGDISINFHGSPFATASNNSDILPGQIHDVAKTQSSYSNDYSKRQRDAIKEDLHQNVDDLLYEMDEKILRLQATIRSRDRQISELNATIQKQNKRIKEYQDVVRTSKELHEAKDKLHRSIQEDFGGDSQVLEKDNVIERLRQDYHQLRMLESDQMLAAAHQITQSSNTREENQIKPEFAREGPRKQFTHNSFHQRRVRRSQPPDSAYETGTGTLCSASIASREPSTFSDDEAEDLMLLRSPTRRESAVQPSSRYEKTPIRPPSIYASSAPPPAPSPPPPPGPLPPPTRNTSETAIRCKKNRRGRHP